MIAMLALSAVINLHGMTTRCQKNYTSLFNASTEHANQRDYLQAAALREGAAQVFQVCFQHAAAPRNGIYPFDGVGAYLVAADLWQLAGESAQATRNLHLGESALRTVMDKKEAVRNNSYVGYVDLMEHMIAERKAGRWGVWCDSEHGRCHNM